MMILKGHLYRVALIIIILLISILSSVGIEYLLTRPVNSIELNSDWLLYNSESEFLGRLDPSFNVKLNDYNQRSPGIYRIESEFYIDDVIDHPTIVITEQPDHGYRLKINGHTITEQGDLTNGNANIWKDTGIFRLGETVKYGVNHISIDVYSSHNILLSIPLFITDYNKELSKLSILRLFNRFLGTFMAGVTVVMGLLFLSIAFISKDETVYETLLGISLIFWSIYILDFNSFNLLFLSFLSFKKLVAISFVLAFLINVVVIYSLLFGGLKRIFINFIIVLSSLLTLFLVYPDNLEIFWKNYTVTNTLCFLFFIPVIFYPKLFLGESRSFNYILMGVVFASFYSLRFIYYDITNKPHQLLGHVGVFVYILFICFYFVKTYIEKHDKLLHMTIRADHYFNQSVIDPLTGVNNRFMLDYVDFEHHSFVMVIIDLDDFKDVNDTYGHDEGDRVLVECTQLIKSKIRERDYVIRLGGDEFLMLLKECPFDRAKVVISHLWEGFNSVKYLKCSGGAIIKEPGESYSSAYKRADENLYQVKKNRKGTFNFSH